MKGKFSPRKLWRELGTTAGALPRLSISLLLESRGGGLVSGCGYLALSVLRLKTSDGGLDENGLG